MHKSAWDRGVNLALAPAKSPSQKKTKEDQLETGRAETTEET